MSMQMGMNLGQQMKLGQHQVLAPRMILSMKILQMPSMDLQEKIEQELEENPVLELKAEAEDEALNADVEPDEEPATTAEDDHDPGDDELTIDPKGDGEEDFDRLDALNRDWEHHFDEDHRPSRNGIDEESDRKHDAMQNMASPPQSLREYLVEQAAFLDLTPAQARLVRHVIDFVDETGYIGKRNEDNAFEKITLEEIAQSYDRPVTVEQVEEAIHLVQRLDPPGVAARDLRECLLLQLKPDTPYRDVVRTLILNHLEDIPYNRLPEIQRRTGYDLGEIKAAIETLKQLNPKPGSQFTPEKATYVVPDIIIDRDDKGEYTVKLVDDWVPEIRINRRYFELAKDKNADKDAREFLKKNIQAAQWLIESIQQRRQTLEKVTRAIVRHQRAFLDKQHDYIEPLKMQQIADEVEVHVTTVSRAVDHKWVQTPRGIFPLKRFFGGGKQATTGEEVSYEAIKQKLQEIIGKEDKANPLSDEELVEKLLAEGLDVARRTVTKYRKMLDIPSSRQRKDWTAISTHGNGAKREEPEIQSQEPEVKHPEPAAVPEPEPDPVALAPQP